MRLDYIFRGYGKTTAEPHLQWYFYICKLGEAIQDFQLYFCHKNWSPIFKQWKLKLRNSESHINIWQFVEKCGYFQFLGVGNTVTIQGYHALFELPRNLGLEQKWDVYSNFLAENKGNEFYFQKEKYTIVIWNRN